jgi:alpha-tubulin suppressor-like RCC1 family protein
MTQTRERLGMLTLMAGLALAPLGCREDATSPAEPEPIPVFSTSSQTPLSFRQMSAGLFHTCGVTTDGRAYCWGDNVSGQLGDDTNVDRAVPTPVAGNLRFSLVSAGATYSCGVTTDERAYCWGQNTTGQLGDGTTTSRLRPVAVGGGRRFRDVRAGYFHTCAVNPFDVAFCWGHNSNGQVGDNTTTTRLLPVRVRGGLSFQRVFTAGLHSCGVTLDNRAYCWGRNEDGQLGDGTTIQKKVPTPVAGGHRFTRVSVGAAHGGDWSSVGCGVTSTDRVYCWGDNRFGQVGDGTSGFGLRRTIPVAVAGGLLFKGVSTGGVHTCGVTTTNRAYCWGSDGNFQLGDGSSFQENQVTPSPVAGGLLFRAITAGTFHSCAITTGDKAYCWGNNFQGQLGIGTTDDGAGFTPKSSPRAVVGPA